MIIKKKWQQQVNRFYSGTAPCYLFTEKYNISRDFFRRWIEHQFISNMSKENYATDWQIDHIVPSKLFDLNKDQDVYLCFHYMNIMPMFNIDNKLKGASIHFSLEVLKSRLINFPDSIELKQLIDICENEIKNRWNKYIK